jgi:hypothetical protein
MHLITTFSNKCSLKRLGEFKRAVFQNMSNEHISSVHILTEDADMDIPGAIIHITETRPTFRTLVNLANSFGDNEICIITNADIVFDFSLENVKFNDHDLVYCLTRWEMNDGELAPWSTGLAYASFDSWIFKTPISKIKNIGFYPGLPGCDTAFTHTLWECGKKPINPTFLIRTLHIHDSEERTYSDDMKVKGNHLGVHPSGMLGFNPHALEFGFSEHGQEDFWPWAWEWVTFLSDFDFWGNDKISEIARNWFPYHCASPEISRAKPDNIDQIRKEWKEKQQQKVDAMVASRYKGVS